MRLRDYLKLIDYPFSEIKAAIFDENNEKLIPVVDTFKILDRKFDCIAMKKTQSDLFLILIP